MSTTKRLKAALAKGRKQRSIGSGFSYLGNYMNPCGGESFKLSGSAGAQPVDYWLPSSEGYAGFPVGPYQSYFTSPKAISSPRTQGLLAVSSSSKSVQRIQKETSSTKNTKASSHPGPKDIPIPPKSGKSRHSSDERKAAKHDTTRSKNKDSSSSVPEEKEVLPLRSSKITPREKHNSGNTIPINELTSPTEIKDSIGGKSDKAAETKPNLQGKPLTVVTECADYETPSHFPPKCKDDSSSVIESLNVGQTPTSVSPKAKEPLTTEKRRKASKKKDLSIDVNGNAVLSNVSSVTENKIVLQTSIARTENGKSLPSLSEAHYIKNNMSTTNIRETTTNDNWNSSTSLVVMPVLSSPCSSLVPSLDSKLSPPPFTCQSTSPLASTARPVGKDTPILTSCSSTTTSVETSSSRSLFPNPMIGNSLRETWSPGCDLTMRTNVGKLTAKQGTLLGVVSPETASMEECRLKGDPMVTNNSTEVAVNLIEAANHSPRGGSLQIGIPGTISGPSASRRSPPLTCNSSRPPPTSSNLTRLSPTSSSKQARSSPLSRSSICSPPSVMSGDSSCDSSEKEKLPSPRSMNSATSLSTCVTSSTTKPISYPGSLPSPSSQHQPPYINHLPIYIHGTGHLSLERDAGREAPRDGSKVHATTFVPALGEFIPGPASSATLTVRELKSKTQSNKEINHSSAILADREKLSSRKEIIKLASSRDQTGVQIRTDVAADKGKGSPPQDGIKSKENLDSKSTSKGSKSDKSDKHDKTIKRSSHSNSKPSHEHHYSDRKAMDCSLHRTTGDSIHRETCHTSDAAVISTNPNVHHGYPHHLAGFSLQMSGSSSSSGSNAPRDITKQDMSSYSSKEHQRYLEWHIAANKRSAGTSSSNSSSSVYCYDRHGIRLPGQDTLKLDSTMMHPLGSFPSPRPDANPDPTRAPEFQTYSTSQDSMLRSVLTAGIHQTTELQRTSPGGSSSNSKAKQGNSGDNKASGESRGNKSMSGKSLSEGLGASQGRLTPGNKGSDGRNPPIGIAVAQKRHDTDATSQGRTSCSATSRNNTTDESEDRPLRSRGLHGADIKHRDTSARSQRDTSELVTPSKYHHRYPGDLGSNLIVTGGASVGPSPHHYDPIDGRMTPSHPLTLPPNWLPRTPGPQHAWLGHPFGLTAPSASLHGVEGGTPGPLQMPPAGFQIARDPSTGQIVLVPQPSSVHSETGVPPNLSMWPYLVPPHLQPHSHQLQQLVLNQPAFGPPLPHQPPHPLTHRPDQPLPSSDYQFALQQHQEVMAQWYLQDEHRQREEQRRREQQASRKGEKTSDKHHKDTKAETHADKVSGSSHGDVLNLKIPPPASYLPGVAISGQPSVPYVYPPQQVQYLYNHTGMYPPPVSCASSPRTELGASLTSPKVAKPNSKLDDILKTALKSISVQTSPSETPASSVEYSAESKPETIPEEDEEEKEKDDNTEESEDHELIIVDVVDDDTNDESMLQSTKLNRDLNAADFGDVTVNIADVATLAETRTSSNGDNDVISDGSDSTPKLATDSDDVVSITSTPDSIAAGANSMTPPSPHNDATVMPCDGTACKESIITNVLTQSFASRMESLDQDHLAAIEGIALLSEVAEQKAFSICSDNDKASPIQTSQTRDDSYLLDTRHQDNGTPLQGNTASAVTSASSGTLQLITQSCPTSPTEFIFKRNTEDGGDKFDPTSDVMNPNEVEMRIRLAELQRKYQEKKRELDKLQRKKEKNPMIKSSTAVLLEAAASLEECLPSFPTSKKKKKKDRDDKDKGKTDEKRRTSKKEGKISHGETLKKKKHKSKDGIPDSSHSPEESMTSSGSKSKSKSKSRSKTSSSRLSCPGKDAKQKGIMKIKKMSSPDATNADPPPAKSMKSPRTSANSKSPHRQNSSTEFDTDSGSIIWPSTHAFAYKASTTLKGKSKTSKKKTKEAKVKKDQVKGQGSSDSVDDTSVEAIIRKFCGSHGTNEGRDANLPMSVAKLAVSAYEDDSDSPWETAIMDAKMKRNMPGHTHQKGLALLAGISSHELKSPTPAKDVKPAVGKDGRTVDGDGAKKKSSKAKKRTGSPAREQENPKKSRKQSPVNITKEKDFEPSIKISKVSKTVKRKEKTVSEPTSLNSMDTTQKKEENKPFFNKEIWTRRRSERIFLNDASPVPSRDASPLAAKTTELGKPQKKVAVATSEPKSPSEGGEQTAATADANGVANIGSVLDALKTDTLQIRKKLASMSAQEEDKEGVPRKTKKKLSKRRDQGKKMRGRQETEGLKRKHEEENRDSSCSDDAENQPLGRWMERENPSAPRSCIIDKDELQKGLRVLMPIDGLFYAGYVDAIQPPDVYGVILDGERGNRPHVFSQEQMLQETFVDVKPLATRYVPEGTRVCAYWSQQFRCLYPGTVVKGTPNPNEDPNFVCVEFDDGDSGRIPVDHIRMLPHDFPIVEFEPIPNELQRKRRRRTSDASSTTNCRSDLMETAEDLGGNRRNIVSLKKKTKTSESTKMGPDPQDGMDRISESGEDDVFLPHLHKPGKGKKSRSHDKTKKYAKDRKSKENKTKKKKKRKRDQKRQDLIAHKRSKRSSSKSPRGSPARSPSRSPTKSKKKKKKEERRKKTSSKTSQDGKSRKSSKKKSSSSGSKKKLYRDDKHNSFCTVETETVYSTHPLGGPVLMIREETSEATRPFDQGKGAWSKHRGTSDRSLDDWSSSDSDRDSSSDSDETSTDSMTSKDNTRLSTGQKNRSTCLPSTSKMTAFLPARQLWNWFGKATQRRGAKGKARKVFYRAILRENEIIRQGDSAVFLSTGRPHLPFIGRIESMWESWGGNMVVRVKWFYHPEETKGGRKSHDGKMALYQSLHVDENDVQTISHKCEVLSVEDYKRYTSGKKHNYPVDKEDVYYLAGTYDPTSGHITSVT